MIPDPTAPRTKVLIVEDEALIAMELETRIREMGHVVVGPVATCNRAIELADRERPDIALMDIHLAGSRDGVDAAVELRARFDLPVIYLTAYSNPETVARAKVTQPQGWLVKPFTERELRITIELSLERHAFEQKLRESNRRLEQALAEVKQLSGLLPICMTCKKIRDDRNYWHTVEAYISRHSEVEFSHSFCPQCLKNYLKENGLEDLTSPAGTEPSS